MKFSLPYMALVSGLISHASAQCVPEAAKVISPGYTVKVECDVYRTGKDKTKGVTSPEACAAICRDSGDTDVVCSYYPPQKECIKTKATSKLATQAGAWLMTPVEDEDDLDCCAELQDSVTQELECAVALDDAKKALSNKDAELADAKKQLAAARDDAAKAQKDLDTCKAAAGAGSGSPPPTTPPSGSGGTKRSGMQCGARVRAQAQHFHGQKIANNAACKAVCAKNPRCKSYSILKPFDNKPRLVCSLHSDVAANLRITPWSHSVFYDMDC